MAVASRARAATACTRRARAERCPSPASPTSPCGGIAGSHPSGAVGCSRKPSWPPTRTAPRPAASPSPLRPCGCAAGRRIARRIPRRSALCPPRSGPSI
eukprot:6799833-Prymnesium_polylepis.1